MIPELVMSATLTAGEPAWPSPARVQEFADLAHTDDEARRARFERLRAALLRWQLQASRRLPCASAAAAFYREQRRLRKLRSRAKGHGVG